MLLAAVHRAERFLNRRRAGRARRLVENQFEGVTAPHAILASSGASLAATGTFYLRSTGARDFTATGFVPAYLYQVESASERVAVLDAEVGPR